MKISLLKIFFCLSFLIFPNICPGESLIRISDFLAGAASDDSLLVEKEALSFLQDTPGASFLDELEFRVNIDEFEGDRQVFAVRFKTRSFSEMRDENRLNVASLRSHQARYGLLLNQALKERYDIVIDYLYFQEMTAVYQELAKVYEDRLKVLQKSAEISGMDPSKFSYDLADAENDLLRAQMKEIELNNRMKLISDEISRNMEADCSIAFDKEKRVGTDQILNTVREIALLSAVKNADLQNAERDSELAAARYDLEKSENGAWFSFVETAYDLEQRYDFDKAFSIGFGISVPIGAENRPEMRARKLEKLKAKKAYEMLKRQNEENIVRLSEELRQLIHQYENFQQKTQSGRDRSHYDLWQQTEGADPMVLLKLRESMLKREMSGTKLLFQIYRRYTDLLDISGKLTEEPLRNHLSEAKEYYEFRA